VLARRHEAISILGKRHRFDPSPVIHIGPQARGADPHQGVRWQWITVLVSARPSFLNWV
jgi:hypothetical protein